MNSNELEALFQMNLREVQTKMNQNRPKWVPEVFFSRFEVGVARCFYLRGFKNGVELMVRNSRVGKK